MPGSIRSQDGIGARGNLNPLIIAFKGVRTRIGGGYGGRYSEGISEWGTTGRYRHFSLSEWSGSGQIYKIDSIDARDNLRIIDSRHPVRQLVVTLQLTLLP
jgi:hypothetical protein